MKANILGDARAEVDRGMLDVAFLETPDYRTLIEPPQDKTIIVGRRGTGKSALVYRLKKHWRDQAKTIVVSWSPEEDQVAGLRALTKYFGADFRLLRAGARVIWKYALLMEMLSVLSRHHKAKKSDQFAQVKVKVDAWSKCNYGVVERIKDALREVIDVSLDVESRVGNLARALQVRELENSLTEMLDDIGSRVYILVDKLDEGYEPDDIGVALIDGLAHASVDMNARYESAKTLIFLRDNMYRALSKRDPDFCRNIEGQTLRLHWDENDLFNLVASRLRVAFSLGQENSARVWDRCVASGLETKDGFRKCLRMTLYRPRDLLILLNDAFYGAGKQGRDRIVEADIVSTSRYISAHRLEDLKKEYEAIVPGVSLLVDAFKNASPELRVSDASTIVQSVLSSETYDPRIQQQFALYASPLDVMRSLYGIGFIGMRDSVAGNYVFCHDGRDPNRGFTDDTRLMIHPCYWMALNIERDGFTANEAEEIYDEYDIAVTSETSEQRNRRIGQLVSRLSEIPEGQEGWVDFEEWCFDAIRVAFAGALSNVEKKPNGAAKQKRDVVGTNHARPKAWKRIYEDYGVRTVLFEIKNYKGMGADEYRQVMSYLSGPYGQCGFLVCRDDEVELVKGKDLDWMRAMYVDKKVIVVKITAKWLASILHKIRSPQKHDAPDKALDSLLDIYCRRYLSIS